MQGKEQKKNWLKKGIHKSGALSVSRVCGLGLSESVSGRSVGADLSELGYKKEWTFCCLFLAELFTNAGRFYMLIILEYVPTEGTFPPV